MPVQGPPGDGERAGVGQNHAGLPRTAQTLALTSKAALALLVQGGCLLSGTPAAGSIASVDPLVLAAAQNNARWCDLVCRSRGLPTVMSEQLWIAPQGSPRLYPNAVTLAPRMAADVVLRDIDTRPGCSVKDSFADVDLEDHGFIELFEASWFAREAAPPQARPRLRWDVVTTEEELTRWAISADLEGVFGPELLRDSTVRFLVVRDEQGPSGGAIVNRTGATVGLSNVFTTAISPGDLWSDLPAAVGDLFDRLPMVGYEHGDELTLALAGGFETIAPLRVWLKRPV
jgi:hypothetical protein